MGASLEVMAADSLRMRGNKPFVFTNMKTGEGITNIIDFIVDKGMLET